MRLKDKVAIITGASRGIGRATAILFAKEGARVTINYKQNKEVADEVRGIVGHGNGIVVQANVSKKEDVKKLISETISKFGRIDILVNNAGIVFDIPLLDKTSEQWEETLKTNLIGTFLCSKLAADSLRKNRGVIVNVSSNNVISAFSPESADYDASKAGIISLTKNLARSLAPDVRVNAVAPGWVDTEMNKDLSKDYMKVEVGKTLLKRIAKPEEIANCILFLASEESSFVNGETLIVDGGYF